MTSAAAVRDFLAQRTIAVVGASRSGKKFGNGAIRALVANGYRVLPVHPDAAVLEGLPCSPSLSSLAEVPDGLLVVVPPPRTEEVLREAAGAGIRRVWMQQGSSSDAAVRFCAERGISEIHGECILMFLREGPAFHRVHRFFRGLFGRLPA